MKKLNKKTKIEQLFILFILCIGCFSMLCITGCGKKSCETFKCGINDSEQGAVASGISIPGCGGCLSSGRGCNSILWPQSCKISYGYSKDTYFDENDKKQHDNNMIFGCDTRYYGGGCLGCAQEEKSCYNGYIDFESQGERVMTGCFYGTSDSKEHLIGCANGCGGCVGSDGMGIEMLKELEEMEGIQ